MDIFAAHDALQIGAVWEEPFDPHAEMLLNGVLVAAFMISSHAGENPIKARLVRESAAKATQARKAKSKKTNDLIQEECKRFDHHQSWATNRIATAIHPSLNEKLKSQNLPSMGISAIGKRIRSFRTNVRSSN